MRRPISRGAAEIRQSPSGLAGPAFLSGLRGEVPATAADSLPSDQRTPQAYWTVCGSGCMERVAEIYYNRLNSSRAMITNLFKMFKFQTGKSKFIETYYER